MGVDVGVDGDGDGDGSNFGRPWPPRSLPPHGPEASRRLSGELIGASGRLQGSLAMPYPPVCVSTILPPHAKCYLVSTTEFSLEGPGYRARLAMAEDGPAICELFRKVPMNGRVAVTQERDPDFFAMPQQHLGEYNVFLIEDDRGKAVGCSTMIRRRGWLRGEPVRTGYLCDLRLLPDYRSSPMGPTVFAAAMRWSREQHGTELFTTVIFDDNKRARAALVAPQKSGASTDKRAVQPSYRPMTPFNMTALHLTTSKPRPERKVDSASARDWDEMCTFLCEGQRRRVLGEDLDETMLSRRLTHWQGFKLEDFLLARGAGGRIVGCMAPWDTGPFKRTRVLEYHGQLAWVRRGFNIGARIAGFPLLPGPGETFRFSFLTHLEVEDDDPAVLRDLLLAAYQRHQGSGAHFLNAMVPIGSKLEGSFKGFTVTRIPTTMYAVHARDSRYREIEFRTQHPGFEMALS